MPTIGEMQHRITVQQKTRGASDASGGYVSETWSTVCTVWAKIDPRAGREMVDAAQVVRRVTHIITMRARTGITPAMRVTYAGRTLAILVVREILEAGRWLEMTCEEGAPS